jgi:O-antigen ligase
MSLPENLAPHNLFVQVAAENGILGAVGLCGLVWLVWRVLFRLESSRDWLPWIEGLRNVALV